MFAEQYKKAYDSIGPSPEKYKEVLINASEALDAAGAKTVNTAEKRKRFRAAGPQRCRQPHYCVFSWRCRSVRKTVLLSTVWWNLFRPHWQTGLYRLKRAVPVRESRWR